MELPAAVWLVLAQCTVVVGAAVVVMVVIKLVSAPGQLVHSHRPRQVLENGTPFFSPQLYCLSCYAFKLLGLASQHYALDVYLTTQVGYKIVIAW